MRILIAEDEKDLNELIRRKLTKEGYSVDCCFNGQEALDILSYTEFDLLLLDIMMPKVDGLKVLETIRKSGNQTPVIFLTAKDAVSDRVQGLDAGAQDYLVKPFSFAELMARIRAATRDQFGLSHNLIEIADLTLDLATKQVQRNGQPIELSAKEYALLEYLMQNQGIILSREKIENHIWNFDYEGGTNVVDVYIRYLRQKIDEPFSKKLIHTVRGRGYTIQDKE